MLVSQSQIGIVCACVVRYSRGGPCMLSRQVPCRGGSKGPADEVVGGSGGICPPPPPPPHTHTHTHATRTRTRTRTHTHKHTHTLLDMLIHTFHKLIHTFHVLYQLTYSRRRNAHKNVTFSQCVMHFQPLRDSNFTNCAGEHAPGPH